MPISGGTFGAMNKVLPGAYINFVSTKKGFQRTEIGVVALPLELSWCDESKVFEITKDDFINYSEELLGYKNDDEKLLLVSEAFKKASKLLLYRVNKGGVKAAKTINTLSVTAKHTGEAGNKIAVAVLANVDNSENVDIVTYFGGKEVDRITVKANRAGNPLNGENSFVSYTSSGTIAAAVRTSLTGGTNGSASGEDYANALKAFETRRFNVIAYCGDDSSIKNILIAFVNRLRDEDGIKIVGVVSAVENPDSKGIIAVQCEGGVKVKNRAVSESQLCAWVAGASSASDINGSNTNALYGEGEITKPLTKKAQETAIKKGKFVFYQDGKEIKVLADINSLTTFVDGGATEDWTSNRVIRVLDGLAMDIAKIFGESYVGKITNNDTGRNLFKCDLISLAETYQRIGAIRDFKVEDIVIKPGTGKRDVEVEMGVIPTDAMEKLYMTVTVM